VVRITFGSLIVTQPCISFYDPISGGERGIRKKKKLTRGRGATDGHTSGNDGPDSIVIEIEMAEVSIERRVVRGGRGFLEDERFETLEVVDGETFESLCAPSEVMRAAHGIASCDGLII
jgi:hypothetical protein